MATYTKPQKRKKEGDRLNGERDKVKFIDLRFERRQVVGLGKEEQDKAFYKLQVFWINGDLWEIISGLGSEIWKGCE